MYNIWNVARRELNAIFIQPIAYVVAIVLLLITGYIFALQLAFTTTTGGPAPVVSNILGTFTFLSLLVIPAVTMRLLSEEQQSGTIELLMTYPVRDYEVILGKWLAGFIYYLFVVAFTLLFPFILIRFGNPDMGPILSGYLGVLLWGAALVAIGVLASAMSEHQINAFIVAVGINLLLYLIGFAGELFTNLVGFSTVFNELSLQEHLTSFLTGLITATDVLYYVIVTAVAIFAATRTLESRRWR